MPRAGQFTVTISRTAVCGCQWPGLPAIWFSSSSSGFFPESVAFGNNERQKNKVRIGSASPCLSSPLPLCMRQGGLGGVPDAGGGPRLGSLSEASGEGEGQGTPCHAAGENSCHDAATTFI